MNMEMEFCCLVYETMRCKSWYQLNGSGVSFNGVREPIPRLAMPQCMVAKKIALVEYPFEHILFRRALNQLRAVSSNTSDCELILQQATNMLHDSRADSATRKGSRKRLKVEMLRFFEKRSAVVIPRLTESMFLSADLDIFFGRWPY
ncbi:hypothetical protein D3C71_1702030 [compost metagenome]